MRGAAAAVGMPEGQRIGIWMARGASGGGGSPGKGAEQSLVAIKDKILGLPAMCSRPLTEFDWLHGDVRDLRERYAHSFRVEDRGAGHWQTVELGGRPPRVLVRRPGQVLRSGRRIPYFHGGRPRC